MGRARSVTTAVACLAAIGTSTTQAVVIQPDESASKDVFTYQFLPTFNFETSGPDFQAVLATSKTSSGHDTHTLVEFDLSAVSIPPEAVTSATLSLYVADGSAVFGGAFGNPTPSETVDVEVLALGGAWEETTVTWSSEPEAAGSVVEVVSIDGIDRWVDFDVTGLVQDWLAGSLTNNGFLLRQVAEVSGPGGLVAAVYDSSSGSNRPFLSVVPEPATSALLALGALIGLRGKRAERG